MLRKVYGTLACEDEREEGMPVPYPLNRLKGEELICLENWVHRLAAQAGSL